MSWDPMGVMEAEAEDMRHRIRYGTPLFHLGILSEPKFIPAGAIFKGQPAQWWIEQMRDREHGLLVNAVDYTPPSKKES